MQQAPCRQTPLPALYYTIIHYTILYYYYTILHYTILYSTRLYYTILYYTIPACLGGHRPEVCLRGAPPGARGGAACPTLIDDDNIYICIYIYIYVCVYIYIYIYILFPSGKRAWFPFGDHPLKLERCSNDTQGELLV